MLLVANCRLILSQQSTECLISPTKQNRIPLAIITYFVSYWTLTLFKQSSSWQCLALNLNPIPGVIFRFADSCWAIANSNSQLHTLCVTRNLTHIPMVLHNCSLTLNFTFFQRLSSGLLPHTELNELGVSSTRLLVHTEPQPYSSRHLHTNCCTVSLTPISTVIFRFLVSCFLTRTIILFQPSPSDFPMHAEEWPGSRVIFMMAGSWWTSPYPAVIFMLLSHSDPQP